MSRNLPDPYDSGAVHGETGDRVAGPPVTPQAHTVEQVLEALHAAREPVYDPTDPIQAEAAQLFFDQTRHAPARLRPAGPCPASHRHTALPYGEGVAYDAAGTPLSITSHHITVPIDASGYGPAEHDAPIAHARAVLDAELRAATAGRTTGLQVSDTETRYRMRKARIGERVIDVYHHIHPTPAATVSELADGTWLVDLVDGPDAQTVPSFPRALELADFHGFLGETPEDTTLVWVSGAQVHTGTVKDLAADCRLADELAAIGWQHGPVLPVVVYAARSDGHLVQCPFGILRETRIPDSGAEPVQETPGQATTVEATRVQVTLGATTAEHTYQIPATTRTASHQRPIQH